MYIALRWSFYLKGYLPSESMSVQHAKGLVSYKNGSEEIDGNEALYRSLDDTISLLSHNGAGKIYIIKPIPENYFDIPIAASRLSLFRDDAYINNKLGLSEEDYYSRNAESIFILEKIAEKYPNVILIDPVPLFIQENDVFKVVDKGRCLYYDDDHLSVLGSMYFKDAFK